MYQLKQPRISGYDTLLVDEAQDLTPGEWLLDFAQGNVLLRIIKCLSVFTIVLYRLYLCYEWLVSFPCSHDVCHHSCVVLKVDCGGPSPTDLQFQRGQGCYGLDPHTS